MFDTKIAIVVREDLAMWQKLNVTAFLSTGIASQSPEVIGEPYRDKAGNVFNAMSIQPIVVMAADLATMARIHGRAIERGVQASAYVDAMFATGHDAANRAVFAETGPDDARIAGLALRADRKLVDKITKGAKLHP